MSDAIRLLLAILAAAGVALAPRLWWVFVGRPRFRRRCDHYVTHIDYAAAAGSTRCQCDNCRAFRREMGWSP